MTATSSLASLALESESTKALEGTRSSFFSTRWRPRWRPWRLCSEAPAGSAPRVGRRRKPPASGGTSSTTTTRRCVSSPVVQIRRDTSLPLRRSISLKRTPARSRARRRRTNRRADERRPPDSRRRVSPLRCVRRYPDGRLTASTDRVPLSSTRKTSRLGRWRTRPWRAKRNGARRRLRRGETRSSRCADWSRRWTRTHGCTANRGTPCGERRSASITPKRMPKRAFERTREGRVQTRVGVFF